MSTLHRLAGRASLYRHPSVSSLRIPSEKPQTCPSCEKEGDFYACGPGVERIEEEIASRFPEARRALVTSDTLSRGQTVEAFVHKMTERHIDILIGTQILAKGFHFPYLTLVGVIDADLGLMGETYAPLKKHIKCCIKSADALDAPNVQDV